MLPRVTENAMAGHVCSWPLIARPCLKEQAGYLKLTDPTDV